MGAHAVWGWAIASIVLMLMELLTPGFVVFFFGLAAASVSVCAWVFSGKFGIYWQIGSFSVFSVIYLVVLRRYVKSIFMGDLESDPVSDELVGRVGKVTELIRPEAPGRVQIRDAEWTASASVRIEPGDEVKVTAHNNLTVTVERL